MLLSEKGVERLKEVAEFIRKDPDGFEMGDWLSKGENRPTHCNTVGCIAGWLVALNRPAAIRIAKSQGNYNPSFGPRIEDKITNIPVVAHTLLGFSADTPYSVRETNSLFLPGDWPEKESRDGILECMEVTEYADPEDPKERKAIKAARRKAAKLAGVRIKAFIKEYKPASK